MKLIMENWREFQKKALIVEGDKKLADVLQDISSYSKNLKPEDIQTLQNLLNSIDLQAGSEIEGNLIGAMLELNTDVIGQTKSAEEAIPEIKKLITQLIDSQSLTPTKIIVAAISSAIGEQIGEKIVDPLVDKIELAVAGGQTAAAGATVATGGGASVPAALFAAALQGLKIFAKKFAKNKAKALITNLISKTINDILSGFEEIENANQVLAKILEKETMQLVNTAVGQDKDPKEKINTIKEIIKSNYDEILKNIFIVAAEGELGDTAKRYTLELINAQILGIPLGPFIGEMILGEETAEKLTDDETKQQLQQLADKAKEEAGGSGEELESDEAEAPDGREAEGEIRITDRIPILREALEELEKDVNTFKKNPSKHLNAFLKKYTNEVKLGDEVTKLEPKLPYLLILDDDRDNYISAIQNALEAIYDEYQELINKYINDINNPEKAADAEDVEVDSDVEIEDKETVEVDGREYTYTDDDVQELIKAYKNFIGEGEGDDGSLGLMKVKTLRQQEQLWIALRDALNNIGKFRPIANQERALTTESINIHEADNTQKAKILIRDLERLRKDLNDTDSTLNGYISKASEGRYEAAAYMARFLAELKDVQNSIGKTIEDTKNFVGVEPMQENLNEAEEESREDKIQNVRNVYENIKDLLRSLPEIGGTTSAEYEEISGNIKRSYEELMKIRKYFRNVGAFEKTSEMDVNEIKEEYLNTRKDLTKTMSRFIEDLRKGDIQKNNAANFMTRLAAVGNFIQETFGVGPDDGYGYKTIEVPSDETSKKEIAKTTSAEPKPSLGSKIIDFGLGIVGDRFSKSRSDNLDKSTDEAPPDAEDLEIVDDEDDAESDTGEDTTKSTAEEAEIPITFETLEKIVKTTAIDNYSNLMVAVKNNNTTEADSIIAQFKKAAKKSPLEEAELTDENKRAIKKFQELKTELKEFIEDHGLKIMRSGDIDKAEFATMLQVFIDQYEILVNLYNELTNIETEEEGKVKTEEESKAKDKAKEKAEKVINKAREKVVDLENESEGQFTEKIKDLYSSIVSSIKSIFGLESEEEQPESEKAPKHSKKYKKFIQSIKKYENNINGDNIKEFEDFISEYKSGGVFSRPDSEVEKALDSIMDIIRDWYNEEYLNKLRDNDRYHGNKKRDAEINYYVDLKKQVKKIIEKNEVVKENLLERLIRQELKVLNGKKMVRY